MELPRLDDATRATIEQFISEIEESAFHSRQFNIVLPELLIEALRIEQEARHEV
jgi:hypothetical protein